MHIGQHCIKWFYSFADFSSEDGGDASAASIEAGNENASPMASSESSNESEEAELTPASTPPRILRRRVRQQLKEAQAGAGQCKISCRLTFSIRQTTQHQ